MTDNEISESCFGSCISEQAWCPDCDRRTKHVLISEFVRECQDCGELSEIIKREAKRHVGRGFSRGVIEGVKDAFREEEGE